jgi:hypothetical protein
MVIGLFDPSHLAIDLRENRRSTFLWTNTGGLLRVLAEMARLGLQLNRWQRLVPMFARRAPGIMGETSLAAIVTRSELAVRVRN